MSNAVFNQYGKYYDLFYQDKNYAAEADYILAVLHKAMPSMRNVLEFGPGTGRHGRVLAKQGFNVVGIEASETMVLSAERTRENGDDCGKGAFRCELGDIRTSRINMKFDAVLSLFHVVSYQTSNDDLLKVFENAARHLKRKGIFFFDVWHGPAVVTQRPAVRVKRIENDTVRVIRVAEPLLDSTAGIVTVTYTVLAESKQSGKLDRFEEQHGLRYLFPTEIAMLAGQTGFSVERSEEFLTGATPSEQTWGVAYLLRKRR